MNMQLNYKQYSNLYNSIEKLKDKYPNVNIEILNKIYEKYNPLFRLNSSEYDYIKQKNKKLLKLIDERFIIKNPYLLITTINNCFHHKLIDDEDIHKFLIKNYLKNELFDNLLEYSKVKNKEEFKQKIYDYLSNNIPIEINYDIYYSYIKSIFRIYIKYIK